ncbi:MAG: T9SS type A sorting domain-containing protein, partial [Flavobacteriales bacterium]|nr:T9SS type A sorting domain-containing protein [Flavobacteriales bacterium]
TQIALWTYEDCSDFSTFELISSNDDGGCGIANGFSSTMFASCLDPELNYMVQIDGWAGETGNGMLQAGPTEQEINLTPIVNSLVCPQDKGGEGDGSIIIDFDGIGSNYDISWTGPNDYTSDQGIINDLSAGVYNAVITDACGNVYNESYEVFNPNPITGVFNVTAPTCPQSGDGQITASFNGGTGPYNYTWTGPDQFLSDQAVLLDLNEGVYDVILLDDNDCPFESSVNLVSENDIAFSLGNDSTICEDATLVLSGPTGLNYEWQDGSTNQFFVVDAEDLELGNYTYILNVATNDGCEAVDVIEITIDACTNVLESEALALNVYPNPAQNRLTLQTSVMPDRVEVYNAYGQMVMQVNNPTGDLNVYALSQGTYFLNALFGNQVEQITFVKQN